MLEFFCAYSKANKFLDINFSRTTYKQEIPEQLMQ